jgi:hypothetical protein
MKDKFGITKVKKVDDDLFIGFAVVVLADAGFPKRFKDGNGIDDIFISTVSKKECVPRNEKAVLEKLKEVVKKIYDIKM